MPRGYSRPEGVVPSHHRSYLFIAFEFRSASLILNPHNSNHVIRPKPKTYQQVSYHSFISDSLSHYLTTALHAVCGWHKLTGRVKSKYVWSSPGIEHVNINYISLHKR